MSEKVCEEGCEACPHYHEQIATLRAEVENWKKWRQEDMDRMDRKLEAAESESTRLKAELAKAEKRGFEKMRLAVVLFFQEKLEAARQQESKNGVILFEKWLEFFNDYRFDGGTHHVQ